MSHPTYRVTCSYCLGSFLTIGNDPRRIARHGFSIQGTHPGQGLRGCWHTGPCDGFGYDHLGISTTGTKKALEAIRGALKYHRDALAHLETKPVLSWDLNTTVFNAKTFRHEEGPSERFDIKPGDPELTYDYYAKAWTMEHIIEVKRPAPTVQPEHQYRIKLPSYQDLWTGKVNEVKEIIRRLESDEARYVKVIETWTPEKYAPVPAQKKSRQVHKKVERDYDLGQGRTLKTVRPACKYTSSGRPGLYLYAEKDEEVTCPRCLRNMPRKEG